MDKTKEMIDSLPIDERTLFYVKQNRNMQFTIFFILMGTILAITGYTQEPKSILLISLGVIFTGISIILDINDTDKLDEEFFEIKRKKNGKNN